MLPSFVPRAVQAASTGEGKLERDGVSGIAEINKQDEEKSTIKFEPIPTQNLAHSEDFYPSTALNALLKQLSDMKMAPQHQEVITALMYIFKDLKLGSVQYLQYTMPVLLQVVRMSDEMLQAFILRQLIDLVRIVQAHMRPYLGDLLDLIIDFWEYSRPKLLTLMLLLLARLAMMLPEDMRDNAGRLVPRFVNLFQEAERSGDYAAMEPALHVRPAANYMTNYTASCRHVDSLATLSSDAGVAGCRQGDLRRVDVTEILCFCRH